MWQRSAGSNGENY